MTLTRSRLIAAGTVRPAAKAEHAGVQADHRAVQARQRDAGSVCKALNVLGRRVVDARGVRPAAYVG